jgi:hypothetical protein
LRRAAKDGRGPFGGGPHHRRPFHRHRGPPLVRGVPHALRFRPRQEPRPPPPAPARPGDPARAGAGRRRARRAGGLAVPAREARRLRARLRDSSTSAAGNSRRTATSSRARTCSPARA